MSDADAIQTLHENDRLKIGFEPGTSGSAVVCFTGIGLAMGGVQREEFRKSVGGVHDVYYVTDRKRHWFNTVYDEARDVLLGALAARPPADLFTLGNSMGGTGALMFAGVLPNCSAAIAFCPQSSVSPALAPFETRWREFVDTIDHWDHPDAVACLTQGPRYTLFYGDQDPQDTAHANRFLEAGLGNLTVVTIAGAGHGAANFLKKKKRLAIGGLIARTHEAGSSGAAEALRKVRHRLWQAPIPAQPQGLFARLRAGFAGTAS